SGYTRRAHAAPLAEDATVTQLMEPTSQYLSDFEALERQPAPPALQRLRKAAVARFAELGFPGPRDEEWRFTPLAPLVQTAFRLPPVDAPVLPAADGALPDGVIVCGL